MTTTPTPQTYQERADEAYAAAHEALQPEAPAGRTLDYLDQRTSIGKAVKEFARKIFPDHWSFLLGEIALYSFVVLVLTGFFLTMFFVPSMNEVTYEGPVAQWHGTEMSEAFASTLRLSFEVRGGLLIRQIHHWAALLFIAAIVAHMFRVFFTGAFRKPRELNWVVGFTLMILALLAGFTGYSLPDDVLSGNGLRIADGVAKSIPILGSYVSYFLFGGEFPGDQIIPRLFTLHILVIPALILAFVGIHLLMVVLHKHTQYPGGGRTDRNVVGYPLFPVYVAKAGGFFFIVFGVLALMGGTMAINNVWNYGPYDPSPVSAGAQPDWYMLFMEGALRLMPGQAEFVTWGGFTVSLNILVPGVVIPLILFSVLGAWPFIEAAATGDKAQHSVLDRPRNVPVRTGVGVAIITAFVVLAVAGSNDIVATHFHLSINAITWALRILLFVGPWLAFVVTKRLALSLQRKDRESVLHGHEHGELYQFADGEVVEVHKPLNDQEVWLRVNYPDRAPLPLEEAPRLPDGKKNPAYKKAKRRSRLSRFFYEDRVVPVTVEEYREALAHVAHDPSAVVTAAPETAAILPAGDDHTESIGHSERNH